MPPVSADVEVDLPEEAWLAALAGLDEMGPARLRAILDRYPPRDAWEVIRSPGAAISAIVRGAGLADRWCEAARAVDVAALWAAYRRAGIGVVGERGAAFPIALRDDPEPPAVLFAAGFPDRVSPRSVGIVGTREATRYGLELAFELGRLVAANGVSVVSGLASGIDAAAHAGALDVVGAPPVAVVGSGADRPYPARNRALWRRVAATGVVWSEAPMGAAPRRWRFPARNRIIAALAEVVVVVESHERGGSLSTASEAMARDRIVFAVPGPIRSPASRGTNRLIADGCLPLCSTDDVFVALDLVASTAGSTEPSVLAAVDAELLEAIGWQPIRLDELAAVVPIEVDELSLRVERLVVAGQLSRRGPYLERVALPRASASSPTRPARVGEPGSLLG